MRTVLLISMFTASLTFAASDYEEERELRLDASGIHAVRVKAGAGSLEIKGVAGLDQIEVDATIYVPGRDDEKAKQKIESDLVLYLEKQGDDAVLHSYFEDGGWNFGDSPHVHLTVRVPQQVGLEINDGSGSITVENVRGDIDVEDGSGSLSLADVGGSITIDDGSGSIEVAGVGGDLSISDGSGSINVREVAGSVSIDDGSGGIEVIDVGQDLIIEESGSGSVRYSDIRGQVETDS